MDGLFHGKPYDLGGFYHPYFWKYPKQTWLAASKLECLASSIFPQTRQLLDRKSWQFFHPTSEVQVDLWFFHPTRFDLASIKFVI